MPEGRSPTILCFALTRTGCPAECSRFDPLHQRDQRWSVRRWDARRHPDRRDHIGYHATASTQLNPDICGAFLDSPADHLFTAAAPDGK